MFNIYNINPLEPEAKIGCLQTFRFFHCQILTQCHVKGIIFFIKQTNEIKVPLNSMYTFKYSPEQNI